MLSIVLVIAIGLSIFLLLTRSREACPRERDGYRCKGDLCDHDDEDKGDIAI